VERIERNTEIVRELEDFVRTGFKPSFGRLDGSLETDPIWRRLRELGTELWLDTGSISDAEKFWTREFSALTTNNTLLNREVQTGRYDSLIAEAAGILADYQDLSKQQRILEIAFILNAYHGLRLVEKFDAFVSVELHTDLAHDIEGTLNYARRYYRICPQRFIVKIPFTPAGLLATRRAAAEGIPINHTLGFSARQNYLIARIAKPAFVNVFLGRLNSFAADNGLGAGTYVGEKATLASQAAVRDLRSRGPARTRQIAASLRAGPQVRDLAGVDVMTMPPKVAGEFLSLAPAPEQLADKTAEDYKPELDDSTAAVLFDSLWDIDDRVIGCVEDLEKEDIDRFGADDLVDFFAQHNCADLLVNWTEQQVQTSLAEGKIPRLGNWRDLLESGVIALDSLMTLAGLNSFTSDQAAMDHRITQTLADVGFA